MSYFQCNSLTVDVTTVIRYQYVFGNGNYCANLHQVDIEQCICCQSAMCGFWGCKNRPAAFPGLMSYKMTVCPFC